MYIQKIYFILQVLFLLLFSTFSKAQYGQDFRQGNPDYPVPEPVALQALTANSPSLLFPATVRDLAFSINSSWINNEVIRSAGIEVAPFFITNSFNLSDYLSGRLIRVLLRTRISFSSEIFSGSGLRGALGFRWMLHDDADLRSDSAFQKALIQLGSENAGIEESCSELQGESESYYSCLTEGVSNLKDYQGKIDSLREALKTSLWNRSVFECAAAILYSSLSQKLAVRQYQFYFNFALPVSTFGQNIFGLSGWVGRSEDINAYQRRGSFIERFSLGDPSHRYFVEASFAAANKFKPDYRLGIGTYYGITNGFGIQLIGSLSLMDREWTGNEARINLIFGTREIHM